MTDVFMVIYCVCCFAFVLMCITSVVYMIHDMIKSSHTGEAVDNDEGVTDDA